MHEFRLRRGGRDGGVPRKRLSYASVVATLALVLAVGGGTAWATNYIITSTHQIKPSVLKKLHGANGKNGKNGKNGTNGTNGTNGAAGATGPAGAAGAAGATGQNGTTGFTSTLPAGDTEGGTWAGDDENSTAGSAFYIPLSFNIPLAAKPASNIIAAGGASTAACPGTVANPKAASGNLCIYEAHFDVGLTISNFDPNVDGGSAGADVFGTVILLSTATTGRAEGTWAVTG
jgi:hypothetical protein